jgi:hypothetical protein
MPEAASARPLGRDLGRGIETDGIHGLASVEVVHVVDAGAWDCIENVFGEIAVRIDHGHSLCRVDITHCEIVEKSAFPESDFPTM